MDAPIAKQIVALALIQVGKPYIFGYEVKFGDPDPKAFDCSELVEWVCARLGVTPRMPDGSYNQFSHCQRYGTLISLDEAKTTEGALVFRRGKNFAIEHVGFSDGKGNTIEARGKNYGVGFWPWRLNWTDAARIPGVVYEDKEKKKGGVK